MFLFSLFAVSRVGIAKPGKQQLCDKQQCQEWALQSLVNSSSAISRADQESLHTKFLYFLCTSWQLLSLLLGLVETTNANPTISARSKKKVCYLPSMIYCKYGPDRCEQPKRLPGSEAGVNYKAGWALPIGCISTCAVSAKLLQRAQKHKPKILNIFQMVRLAI